MPADPRGHQTALAIYPSERKRCSIWEGIEIRSGIAPIDLSRNTANPRFHRTAGFAARAVKRQGVRRQLYRWAEGGTKTQRNEVRQLSPEHHINTGEHQFQLSPRQLTDAFSELVAIDGDNKRDIRN